MQDVLLHVTDRWPQAIDCEECAGVVFLDHAKAFDIVDHACTFVVKAELLWFSL